MNPKTAVEIIRQGAETLKLSGIADAHHDARALMKMALSTGEDSSLPLAMRFISDDQLQAFERLIARRATREPLQHILGQATIFELAVKSDRRALVPRQDSAELIALALLCMNRRHADTFVMADLGTGSGVLLAECLHHFRNARGIAVEQDPDALALAAENFENLALTTRTQLFAGSWRDWSGWDECELIISNPPYIKSDVIPTLQPEVRDHDPHAALDGGADGLEAYREIIDLAGEHMRPGALLIFEIGFDQNHAVSALLLEAGFTDLRHQQDMGGNDRAIAATKS